MTRALPGAGLIDRVLEFSVIGSFTSFGPRLRRRLERWDDFEGGASGRRVLVTGANRGLGLAAARGLLARGADLVVTGRDAARAAAARDLAVDGVLADGTDIPRETLLARTTAVVLDLDDLASVRALATTLGRQPPLDVLVHNAGAMYAARAVTGDGLERTYQTHVVAPFLLSALLVPSLAGRPDPRVITVSSGGMYTERLVVRRVDSPGGYRPAVAYARAKRAQVELQHELHRRLAATTGIAFHAMHPGWASTDGLAESLPAFHRTLRPLLRTPEEAIDTVVHLALAPRQGPDLHGGAFWHDRRVRPTSRLRRTVCDSTEREALWDRLVMETGVDPSMTT